MKGAGFIWRAFIPAAWTLRKETHYEVLNWNNVSPARTLLSNLQNKTDVVSTERRVFISSWMCLTALILGALCPAVRSHPCLLHPSPTGLDSQLRRVFFLSLFFFFKESAACTPIWGPLWSPPALIPAYPGGRWRDWREEDGSSGREWALLAGRDLLVAVFSGKWEEIRRLNCGERFSYSPKGSVLLLWKLWVCFSLTDLPPSHLHP